MDLMFKTPPLGDLEILSKFTFSASSVDKGWEGQEKGGLVATDWLG